MVTSAAATLHSASSRGEGRATTTTAAGPRVRSLRRIQFAPESSGASGAEAASPTLAASVQPLSHAESEESSPQRRGGLRKSSLQQQTAGAGALGTGPSPALVGDADDAASAQQRVVMGLCVDCVALVRGA